MREAMRSAAAEAGGANPLTVGSRLANSILTQAGVAGVLLTLTLCAGGYVGWKVATATLEDHAETNEALVGIVSQTKAMADALKELNANVDRLADSLNISNTLRQHELDRMRRPDPYSAFDSRRRRDAEDPR